MERLPGNTKNRLFTRSWTARVRLVHPWADLSLTCLSPVSHLSLTCLSHMCLTCVSRVSRLSLNCLSLFSHLSLTFLSPVSCLSFTYLSHVCVTCVSPVSHLSLTCLSLGSHVPVTYYALTCVYHSLTCVVSLTLLLPSPAAVCHIYIYISIYMCRITHLHMSCNPLALLTSPVVGQHPNPHPPLI